ncbi:MAG: HmuY family protein [Ferruginibacter sp.]
MKHLSYLTILAALAFASCKKDVDPIIPPTNDAEVQLNGIAAAEPGSAAGNAVYLDLAASQQKAVLRSSWDIGFYCGTDFRVVLNTTSVTGAKVLGTTDINAVGAADTIGLALTTSQTNPLPEQLAYFDDISGDLTKTVIPAIAAADADNKVVIINRGTGGGIAARPWMKIRILRNNNGYTLQYARITETTFKTLLIPKNDIYHFRNVSLENGLVDNQPEKDKWDIMWSYSLFQANFGAGNVPYNFSDMIAVNYLSGVTVAQKVYGDAATALAAYNNFNKDSVANTTMLSGKWTIGSSWRSTQPATGARQDRFYVIKDAAGNYYKWKCVAMGVGTDGGFRGKPQFKYSLIK